MSGMDRDEGPTPAAPSAPSDDPQPMTLERFAALNARIAEGKESTETIVTRDGLALDEWIRTRDAFFAAVAREALDQGETSLADRYAELLVEAQEKLAPPPELTPEAWAALVVAANRGGLDAALEAQALGRADYARLARHWSARLGREPLTARRYAEAFYAATKAGG